MPPYRSFSLKREKKRMKREEEITKMKKRDGQSGAGNGMEKTKSQFYSSSPAKIKDTTPNQRAFPFPF